MTTLEDRDLRQVVDLVAVNVEDCLERLDRIETTQREHGRMLYLVMAQLGIPRTWFVTVDGGTPSDPDAYQLEGERNPYTRRDLGYAGFGNIRDSGASSVIVTLMYVDGDPAKLWLDQEETPVFGGSGQLYLPSANRVETVAALEAAGFVPKQRIIDVG